MILRTCRFFVAFVLALLVGSTSEATGVSRDPDRQELVRQLESEWPEEFVEALRVLVEPGGDVPEPQHAIAPANDSFANAATITLAVDPNLPPLPTFGDNLDATKEPGEPNHRENAGGKSVWWRWTTAIPARVQLFSSNSNFPTLLAVYTGSAVNALTAVAHDQFNQQQDESFTFNAQVGTTYFIAVDGRDGQAGQIELGLAGVPATPPSITEQPADVSVPFAGELILSVQATGTAPFTFQWYKNGQPWEGRVSASVRDFNVQPSASGAYYVVVSNPFGSVTSRTVTVSVGNPAAPQITTQPAPVTVTPPQQIAISVGAAGAGTLSYQWYFNGNALPGETTPNLRRDTPQPSHTGDYYVTVSNAGGTVTSNVVRVTVNASASAPVFTTHPGSQTVAAGSTVTLTAAANGSPAATYEWKFNGTPIANATSATLTLSNVQPANAGSYTVTAINSAGSATSNAATLTVSASPPPASSGGGGGGASGGGGGAPSAWFFIFVAAVLALRRRRTFH